MKRILIAGGSGLIGNALQLASKAKGYSLTILSRKLHPNGIVWDPGKGFMDLHKEESFDAIINLAGESIGEKRWTPDRKKAILSSRLDACHTLFKYMKDGLISTRAYIGSSGIGVYGDNGDRIIAEPDQPPLPADWLSGVVVEWEKAHMTFAELVPRICILRTGIVLSAEGGALAEVFKKSPPFIYPYFGTGRQYWSWIHIKDMAGMILHCIDNNDSNGMYHATAPVAVSNKDLMKLLRACDKKPSLLIGIPAIVLKLMLGELHKPLIDSIRVIPQRIMQEGYEFQYPQADAAIRDVLSKRL